MSPEQALAHLRARARGLDDLAAETGLRDRAAFLRLSAPGPDGAPPRWAVVRRAADGRSSVSVEGGWSLDRLDDGRVDDAVRLLLDDHVGVATAYLRSGARRRRGRFGLPVLVVETPDGERVLRRSLGAHVRALLDPRD